MFKKGLLLVGFISTFFLSGNLRSQNLSSSEILLQIQKLNTVGSVLYIAAHPDDENTRLLSYLASERKLRTGYLSITRGDGGQNLIGKEQGELLGLIRTHELLAARKVDGAEQFFTRANDFGYSKNPEETFQFWNRDSILRDMVWVIRNFKPDVIINRFPTTGEGGHGHHTASAILALEAFEAAGNPNRFPEQLKFTEVWQAKRLFWNTFNFGTNNTTAPNQLKIDVGVYNALLGKNYGEIASESRSMHKSQGFGSLKQRGELMEYFVQLKGDSVSKDLFEGIDLSWNRISNTKALQTQLDAIINQYQPNQPSASVAALSDFFRNLQALKNLNPTEEYWRKKKLQETESLILSCASIWLEASATEFSAVPGDEITVLAQVINRSGVSAQLNKISYFDQKDTLTNLSLKTNLFHSFKQKHHIPLQQNYSSPYWLNEKYEQGRYTVRDPKMIGVPENEAAPGLVFHLEVNGLPLNIYRGLVYKSADPVKGEVYRPFEILPPAVINFSEKVFLFTGSETKKIQIRVKSNTKNIAGTIQLAPGDGWKVDIKKPEFSLKEKGDEYVTEAYLSALNHAKNERISAQLNIKDKFYSKAIQRVEYDHIPYRFILKDAEALLTRVDIQLTELNIGYIPGAGDEVANCLKEIGYKVTELSDEMLATGKLEDFAAIVSGVRAYNTKDKLQIYYPRLMEYVKNGGNLVVQYNTNNRIGPLLAKIAPYPFTISRERVTDENAKVVFLQKGHPALNSPNKIDEKDFEGWVQERGIYFATETDSSFTKILAMADPNEKSSEGSLIIAPFGKGNFVYTGLSFFRQLPAGVPGAYRLFVNLLSLPKNKP